MDRKQKLTELCKSLKEINATMRLGKKILLGLIFGFAAVFYLLSIFNVIPKEVFDENKIYVFVFVIFALIVEVFPLWLEDVINFLKISIFKSEIIKTIKKHFPDATNRDIGKTLNYMQLLLKKDADGKRCEERLSFFLKDEKINKE